ncbi:MAG: DNA replication and repair protein RecF [Syntrophus sp. SKADARSKE-3]|nr:DNA replication and repair protein RecF [Syntrophus sp. SKADARSKE-3]
MRLNWLKISNYRNLKDFFINFNEQQPTTILLGHNGTGKSNLIEAIVEIFRELELGNSPPFAYSMQYVCRQKTILIDADPARKSKRLGITANGRPVAQNAFQNDLANYLPNYIFAYYSGWNSRLERHFDAPTRRYYDRILNSGNHEMPLRRMFFCRKEYSQLVLLAFFLAESNSARHFLSKYLKIRHFDSSLFILKRPWWRRHVMALDPLEDEHFWYARGAFTVFLDRLWQRSLAPIHNYESIERDVRRQGERTERLYLYIKNATELDGLRHSDEDSKTFFGYLESLFLCDLIDEVRITVEKMDGTRIKFAQLSEGEQQLLTVLGLLLFTQNDESLYLLDEPDTHLNPVWTYDFLKLLQENIRAEKGQLIVATHNPLMIGSLHKNQVRILAQNERGITAAKPEYDPRGIGIEGLLKSELYGLRSTLPPEILNKLDRHYLLLGKSDKSNAEQAELMLLANQLNDLGIARTHPNPYFEQFANAMAKRTPTPEKTLTKEDIAAQARLADEVIAEILIEEKEEGANRPA